MAISKQFPTSHAQSESKQHTPSTLGGKDEDQKNGKPNHTSNKPFKAPNPSTAGARQTHRPFNRSSHRSNLVLLPPEILDIICEELHKEDIPALRVQCRYLCKVATSHLFRSVNLRLKKTSIESLLQVSKHPTLSHKVRTILYEPNLLQDQPRKTWEENTWVTEPPDMSSLPPPPRQSASGREWRLYIGAVKKSCQLDRQRKPYPPGKLDVAWSIYQRYLKEQEEFIERDYASKEIHEAIKDFPNLTGIHVNYGWGLWSGNISMNPYIDGLCHAVSGSRGLAIPGLAQALSLVRMLSQGNLRLRSFRIGSLNWRFFEICAVDDADFNYLDRTKRIVHSLQDIKLVINTWSATRDDEDEDQSWEIKECRQLLKNGVLGEVLAEAADLCKLAIAFDAHEHLCPIDFQYLALDTHWPRLHTVNLGCIDAHEKDWMAFFERHATTIKRVSFTSIRLLDGRWPDILERMQRLLALREACFCCTLLGDDPGQMWFLDPPGYTSSKDDSVQQNRTRWALQEFMLHGGVCPLRDEEAHPQVPYDYNITNGH